MSRQQGPRIPAHDSLRCVCVETLYTRRRVAVRAVSAEVGSRDGVACLGECPRESTHARAVRGDAVREDDRGRQLGRCRRQVQRCGRATIELERDLAWARPFELREPGDAHEERHECEHRDAFAQLQHDSMIAAALT